jgi:hypothetical protein
MQHISIDPRQKHAPTRDMLVPTFSTQLPPAKEIKVHPSNAGEENASLFFVGTATTIMYVENNSIRWQKLIDTANGPVSG